MISNSTPAVSRAGAAQLVHMLARREISALELCDAMVAHIESTDGPINAVVVRDFERAREQARTADAALARGERRMLLGVPMTVKESYDVAGLPTTWGFVDFKNHRADVDALAVARLKAAGAVILGKTNVPPGLADWQTANPLYGRTNNPLDHERSPGGSSGGSAAALAAFMVPLEMGSDIGGSIRVPAHFCGVFGHKPSIGVLPRRGHRPPNTDGAGSTLAAIGPLARHAEDLILAFDATVGADTDDEVGLTIAPPAARITSLQGARLLMLNTHPACPTDADTRTALDALASDLTRAGARVARQSALLPDLADAHRVYVALLMTETSRRMPQAEPSISAHEWLALLDERARLCARWAALFRDFDAVLTPVFGTPAFKQFDEGPWQERKLVIDGQPTPYGDQLGWPGVATLPGLPATVAPIASSSDGLPIGVQIIGPWLEDRTSLVLAGLIEQLRS